MRKAIFGLCILALLSAAASAQVDSDAQLDRLTAAIQRPESHISWTQCVLAITSSITVFVASIAALVALAQSQRAKLFELLKYLEDPKLREARRIVYYKIGVKQGRWWPRRDTEWWENDGVKHELEKAAAAVCASYDILGRIIEFDRVDRLLGKFGIGVGHFFAKNWANSAVVLYEILKPYVDHRRKENVDAYRGFVILYQRSKQPVTKHKSETKRTRSGGIGAIACVIIQFLKSIDSLITAIATVLLVFATIILAYIACLQWKTAEKTDKTLMATNKTLSLTLVAANRAWLAPRRVRVDGKLVEGSNLEYLIDYENVGKQPALDVGIFEDADSPGTVDIPSEGASWYSVFEGVANNSCNGKVPRKGDLVIYPGPGDRPYSVRTKYPVPKDVFERKKVLMLKGCMIYKTFDELRQSAFCFILAPIAGLPPEEWKFVRCPTGNFAN